MQTVGFSYRNCVDKQMTLNCRNKWALTVFLVSIPSMVLAESSRLPGAAASNPAFFSSLRRAETLNQQAESSLWRGQAAPVFRYPGEDTSLGDGFALLDAMMRSADPAARMRAVEGYARFASREALSRLMDALFDPDPQVGGVAAQGLRIQLRSPDAAGQRPWLRDRILDRVIALEGAPGTSFARNIPELREILGPEMISVLQDATQGVALRRAAALCLGWMRCEEAAGVLVETVLTDDAALAVAGADALYRMGELGLVSVWRNLLQHSERAVRVIAVEALAGLGGPEAFDALCAVALREVAIDRDLQERAVAALAQWPSPVSVPLLVDVMERNPALRARAAQMLREKTGMNLGDMPGEWRRALEGPPTPQQPTGPALPPP